jgi:hypothetical protein
MALISKKCRVLTFYEFIKPDRAVKKAVFEKLDEKNCGGLSPGGIIRKRRVTLLKLLESVKISEWGMILTRRSRAAHFLSAICFHLRY